MLSFNLLNHGVMLKLCVLTELLRVIYHSFGDAAKVLRLTLQRPLHLEPYCRSRDPAVTVHAYDLWLGASMKRLDDVGNS